MRFPVVGAKLRLIGSIIPPILSVELLDDVVGAHARIVCGAPGPDEAAHVAVDRLEEREKIGRLVAGSPGNAVGEEIMRVPGMGHAPAAHPSQPLQSQTLHAGRLRAVAKDLVVVPFVDLPTAAIAQPHADVEIGAFDQLERRCRRGDERGIVFRAAVGCIRVGAGRKGPQPSPPAVEAADDGSRCERCERAPIAADRNVVGRAGRREQPRERRRGAGRRLGRSRLRKHRDERAHAE